MKKNNKEVEKVFKIEYTFEGFGSAYVRAKNEEEAEEKFNDGEYDYEKECDEERSSVFIESICEEGLVLEHVFGDTSYGKCDTNEEEGK